MKIVLSAVLALVLLGCGEENKNEIHKAEPVKKQVEQVVEKVTKTVEPTKKQVVDKVTEAVKPVKKQVEQVVQNVTQTIVSVDGKVVFKTCAGCHGASAEKPALGKSKVIKGWDSSKVEAALNGYKDGSYGGSMKGLMKAQVSKLKEADIKAVSKYISEL